ncbi:hypothetical protein E1A91_A12G009500v1 [Gossypium mustelinum]|uniref:OTU domain-containing protein n=1 Tax=Gossypium mustelinum TaxID=34275 RepID=A0A5D2WN98_GOSMU|nr:hypothetical protein E1A91_A12G009500v1 [Gossypium mustelinum]
MADVQDIDGKPCEEKLPSTSLKHETRDEILSRHRKEISQLQNKEIELKKAAAKGSKAEQKAKKKQVEEEISQLSANLKEKHAEELASLGFSYNGNDKSNTDNLVKAIAGLSVAPQIMIEDEKFERKLKPLGFTIKEIKSDGHCPYRAVEDQLSLQSGDSSPYAYQELREMAAAYMRKHFMGPGLNWVITHIMIYSRSFPDVEMGKEYKSDGGSSSSTGTIRLSYHKHAFGRGEHYNFVFPHLNIQV